MSRFVILLVVCLCIFTSYVPSQAGTINFKMVCNDTDLLVGEVATVYVQAWVDDPISVAGNGLDTWQLDLGVDNGGVVSITDITMIAPDPDQWAGWDAASLNNPVGAVAAVNVTQNVIGADSDTGVGGYSDIFSFRIEAVAEGIVTYDIGGDIADFFAYLADDTFFEGTGMHFDAAGSDNIFTVVPEPCSILLLGIGCMALRRRS